MRKTVNKRPFNSAIRLPRIDLEYPILSPPSLRPLKVQKEVKCNPKQQNPPRVLISDDSSHQQPHQDNYFVNGSATDDESDGSITGVKSFKFFCFSIRERV